MKKLLLLATLLLGACSLDDARREIDIQLYPNYTPAYIMFAFEQGDVIVEVNGQNKLAQRLLELVQQGYYNGSSIYNTVPGRMVQFGEAYWQGGSSPRIMAGFPPRPTRELKGNNVALPVLARPTPDTIIVGPQVIIASNFAVSAAQVGHDVVPIGKVVQGEEFMKKAVKGDKIISAAIGQNIAK
ncbi:MAG TPA: peptidylprolyl isomerase [Alphaproteobacteria bacterium]|nr:peptidylprolyl isomerase [Alphaproteobacteria bacterium]